MPISRRQRPKPRDNAYALKPFLADIFLNVLHRTDRIEQIRTGNTNETIRVRARELDNISIGKDSLAGPIPRAETYLRHAGSVHQGNQLVGSPPFCRAIPSLRGIVRRGVVPREHLPKGILQRLILRDRVGIGLE